MNSNGTTERDTDGQGLEDQSMRGLRDAGTAQVAQVQAVRGHRAGWPAGQGRGSRQGGRAGVARGNVGMNAAEWENSRSDVPDLLARWTRGHVVESCSAVWRGWWCTRPEGHTGRHAASNGYAVVAVWDDPS